ncbi:hypothetical protein [Actinomadura sp. CNU-125]|uniref:hypothetical protein n=1 Tax=Actinomadura sp. CNU-125 TaxID=1904961 RepID=UPI0011785F8F|nr:hypothetical protein [Actinomadura sp. CNU-125]
MRLDTPAPLPSRRRIVGAGRADRRARHGRWWPGSRWTGRARSARGSPRPAGRLAAIAGVLAARRKLAYAAQVRWLISADRLHVRTRPGERTPLEIPASRIAAVVLGPGLRADPLTGEPHRTELAALAFGHRLELLARLPADELDAFQLAHALDDQGYRVITPGARVPRRPHYGLDRVPEVFPWVPGGRLVVADGGLGWADAAGDVVMQVPGEHLGVIELLTIAGHAWVRLHDADGDELLAAPLSALRISRTDLRESARREGLPVNDAEYDAYLSAAFHSAVSTLADPGPDAEPAPASLAPGAAREGGTDARPAERAAEDSEDRASDDADTEDIPAVPGFALSLDAPPGPAAAPGTTLDATRRSRIGTYAMSVALCEVTALLGAVWLGPELGGFGLVASWAVPAGVLVGLAGNWLYDRNRSQLRVSAAGLAVVTRRGRVEWELGRDRIGGVGVDESSARMPRLVAWGPSGRVLRQVAFPPDLTELRRACERYGVPWGPPDADRPAPPPPEL